VRLSKSEHETAVARIVDYAEDLNLNPEVLDRTENHEGYDFIDQIQFDIGNNQVAYVVAPFGERCVYLIYEYDVVQTVAGSLTEADVDRILNEEGDEDFDGESAGNYEAAVRIFKQTSEEVLESLIVLVYSVGTSENIMVSTERDHGVSFSGYQQQAVLCPFEDDFGFTSFVESETALLSMSKRTREFLRTQIRIQTPDEGETEQYELRVS
jgi:hypothetical protein